jgi:hypothetical protein
LKTFLTQIRSVLPLTPDPPIICLWKWIGWKDYEVPKNRNLESVSAKNVILLSPTACVPAHLYPSDPPGYSQVRSLLNTQSPSSLFLDVLDSQFPSNDCAAYLPPCRVSAQMQVGPSRCKLGEKHAQEAREEDTVGADQQWRPAWSRTATRGGEPSSCDELLHPAAPSVVMSCSGPPPRALRRAALYAVAPCCARQVPSRFGAPMGRSVTAGLEETGKQSRNTRGRPFLRAREEGASVSRASTGGRERSPPPPPTGHHTTGVVCEREK